MFDWGIPVDLDVPGPEFVTPVDDVKGPSSPAQTLNQPIPN
jgi:hypothetical protein